MTEAKPPTGTGAGVIAKVFDVPIYYKDEWEVGIGGGLWSTGRALSSYLATSHASTCLRALASTVASRNGDGLSILELGSGNGCLAACLAACATANKIKIKQLVITDLEDHLELIQKTVDANPCAFSSVETTVVAEHAWGSSIPIQNAVESFDLIIGSDVAYGKHVYDPLIQSMMRFSGPDTGLLVGFTMFDTKVEFFESLTKAGFQYRRLSDRLLSIDYRGTTFGVFAIKRVEHKRQKQLS